MTDFAGLPKPKLVDLMNIVGVRVKVKWREIGLGLGFEGWELDGIKAAKAGEINQPQSCMTEVFTKWKDAMKCDYSWKKLAELLESPAVDEKGLVREMYKKTFEVELLANERLC